MNFKTPIDNNLTPNMGRKKAAEKTEGHGFNSMLNEKTTKFKDQDHDDKQTKMYAQTKKKNVKIHQQSDPKEVENNEKLNGEEMDKTVEPVADEILFLHIVEWMDVLTALLENEDVKASGNEDLTLAMKDLKLGLHEIQALLEGNRVTEGGLEATKIAELKQMLEHLFMDFKISLEDTSINPPLEDLDKLLSQVNELMGQVEEKMVLYQDDVEAGTSMKAKDQQRNPTVFNPQEQTPTHKSSITIETQIHPEQGKSMEQNGSNPKNPLNFMDKEQKGFMANEVLKEIPSQLWVDTNGNLIDTSKVEAMNTAKINFVNIVEQVVEKAEIFLGEKDSEMLLQLKPDHLGKLSMKIAVEKGIVIANIIAENQAVKEVLESNFNILKDALNQKGFGIQELNVSVGQNDDFEKQQQFMKFKKQGNRKTLSKILHTGQPGFIEEEQRSQVMLSTNFDYLA